MPLLNSLALSAQITLDLHSLNNEGTEGNQQQTRMVHIIDENKRRAIVNAISGDMFKHILVGHLTPLLQEVGQPLSGPARRLDPDRITADEKFLKKAKDHKGPNSELLSHILRDCSVTDMAGALFVDEALPRKSVVEFGWCVGLPANDKGEPLTTTEQYFHVKYGAERETAAGGDTTVGKQPIFHRPASSGIYALICNLDLYRIGLNDITREYVIDPASRKARGTALLHSLAATLLKPTGAQRNTQNPHIVGCRGVIATSSTSLPAPTVSPLNHEYAEEIDSAAAVLNGIRPSSVKVMKFETISEGAKILAELARELELPA